MAHDVRSSGYAHVKKRWEANLADHFAMREWPNIPNPTAARVAYDRAATPQHAFAEEARERVADKLREVRQKLTGFATKAEQASRASGEPA